MSLSLVRDDAPPKHTLRPYQIAGVEAVLRDLSTEAVGTLLLMATGTGKTQTACEIMHRWLAERGHKTRILFLAHRDELIQQAARRIDHMLGFGVDTEKAEHFDEKQHAIVVGSVQTMSRPGRLARHKPDAFSLIVVDECFPAGTLIDGRPIETVRVGDAVRSYDEASGSMVRRRVARLFVSRPSGLVRVTTPGGSVVCTPSHPFLTPGGWRPASTLQCGGMVLSTMYGHHANDMRPLRRRDGQAPTSPLAAAVLRPVHRGAEGGEVESWITPLRDLSTARGVVREGGAGGFPSRTGVLLRGTQAPMDQCGRGAAHGADESPSRLRSHEGTKPDALAGHASDRESETPSAGLAGLVAAWRQRAGSDLATAAHGVRPRVADGSGDPDRRQGSRVSDLLQVRHRQSGVDDRRGDRWPVALWPAGGGSEARCVPEWARVDGVEVLEPGSDGTYGGVCADGLVYNFEVEGTHTYVANGFIVHNCHHAASDSYVRILDHFTGAKRLGLTATATRADGKKLGTDWETIAFEYGLRQAIADGFLVPIRRKAVHVDGLRLDDIQTRGGDLVAGQLEAKVLEDEATVHAWARGILDAAPDRKVIAFCPGVESSRRLAECLNRYATDEGKAEIAVHLDGETEQNDRRLQLARFARGDFRVLTNCGLFLEGYDEPSITCVAMCRPTKSHTLYVQCLGRGTRLYPPDKVDLLVIDFTSNSQRHDIVTAIDILADDESEAVRADAEKLLEADPSLTVEQGIEKARKRAEAKALRDAEEAERRRTASERAHVRAKAQVVTFDIDRDPDAFLGVRKDAAHYKAQRFGAQPLSPKQLAIVAKVYETDQASDEGRALDRERFNALIKRMSADLCSVPMAKVLAKRGFDPNVPFAVARAQIDAIAACGWRPSPSDRSRIEGLARGRDPGMEG